MKKLFAMAAFMLCIFTAWAVEDGVASMEQDRGDDADISVSVTAARNSRENSDVPASVTVITGKQLEGRSVAEAVSLYAGIDMKSFNGSSATAQPSSRGFTENGQGRVLVLYDGVKMNNPDMAAINWQAVPAGNIGRIEVLRGGGSSLYGDYAVAAVVNIITKKPEKGLSFSTSLTSGNSSFEEKKINVSSSGEYFSVSVSALDSSTDGWRERSGTENTHFTLELESKAGGYAGGSVFLSTGREMHEMPGGLTLEQFKKDPSAAANLYDEAVTDSALVRFSGNFFLADFLEAKVSAGYSSRKTETDMVSWASYTDTALDSVSLSPSVTADFPLILHGASISAGADFVTDEMDVRRYSDYLRSSRTFSGKVAKEGYGFFSRADVFLAEKLVLSMSGRYDSAEYRSDLEEAAADERHTAAVWGAGLGFLFLENSKIYARYEKVFRYPFLDEQIVYSGYGSDGITEDLEPEHGHSFDAGAEYNGSGSFSAGINLFCVIMDDEIAYNNATWQNENISGTLRYGIESYAAVKPAQVFSITGTYNFTVAKFTDGGDEGNIVPMVPEHRFSLIPELRITDKSRVYSEIIYSGKYFAGGDSANSEGMIDSYLLLNAGGDMTISSGRSKLNIFGKIRNIADREYAQLVYYSLYYPGAGREFEIGASYSY